MSNALTVLLTDEQLAKIADMIHARLALPARTMNGREAAKVCGVSPDTIRRLVKAGVLVPIPAIRTLRFTTDEINRYLNTK